MDQDEMRQRDGGSGIDAIDGQGVDADDEGRTLGDTSSASTGMGTTGSGAGMGGGSGMGGSGMGTGMGGGSSMGSTGGDLGGDDLSGDGDTGSDLAGGLGNARPGAGSDWTPGMTSGGANPVLGGEDRESVGGSWGNRSGSGSGGQGEGEMTEDGTLSGEVSEDITGSAGTNG
jgi:hypothetical protein